MNVNALVAACRPRQWPKNLLVYASALFSFRADPQIWLSSSIALVSFCLISSAVYLVNDVIDVEADRAHSSKCRRPIASGALPIPFALAAAAILFCASLALAASISQGLAGVILAYALIQLAYCLQLKRQPLLDIFCIASGLLLRALAGLVASGLGASPWFLLTIGLLALFLAVEKRKAELRISLERGVVTRHVLFPAPAAAARIPGGQQCLHGLRPLECWPHPEGSTHQLDAAHRSLCAGGNFPLPAPQRS